jgi:pyruvate dehydrogenase E2 component (dihydrolipoamide acetyltransferase)
MAEYLLPDVGEGLTEAEIVSWKVKVGDVVAVNDIVVEIETAKSLVELPSPYAGTVSALLVPEGETVPVGTPIIAIGGPTAQGPGSSASGSSAGPEVIDTNVPPEGNPTLVGYGPREVVAMRRPRKGSVSPRPESAAATQLQLQGAFAPGGAQSGPVLEYDEPAVPATGATDIAPVGHRALAKPPVRKLARDLGVDLALVTPTGPNATITRGDVEAAAGAAASGAPTSGPSLRAPGPGAVPLERERREPVKGVRKMMAEAMVSSAFSAPHVTEWVTVDVTRTKELVDRLKLRPEFRDVKVSPLLVLARAVILAMRRTPEVNSVWDQAAQEVVYKGYVNLGIAAATPRGLVVPNLKEAQDLPLVDLARGLNQLAATAREGRTQPAEMSGGTFTITNVGVFGIDSGTPIINPGESAILAFGAVRKQPWVVPTDTGDAIAVRQVTTLALSFDHRHIDGASGSRFLADVAAILEDPGAALLA